MKAVSLIETGVSSRVGTDGDVVRGVVVEDNEVSCFTLNTEMEGYFEFLSQC
jgi:hypothetical protein